MDIPIIQLHHALHLDQEIVIDPAQAMPYVMPNFPLPVSMDKKIAVFVAVVMLVVAGVVVSQKMQFGNLRGQAVGGSATTATSPSGGSAPTTEPQGACCNQSNQCVLTTQTVCTQFIYRWNGSVDCTPNPCLPPPPPPPVTCTQPDPDKITSNEEPWGVAAVKQVAENIAQSQCNAWVQTQSFTCGDGCRSKTTMKYQLVKTVPYGKKWKATGKCIAVGSCVVSSAAATVPSTTVQ